ncbi:hypothetical protein KIW84_025038 [Lathyrus oleraceus]|uniref:Uncharacterized protein n=1 Tax=Pisum sativum TaxID=3888 RepID=A0A9D4YJD7_PEA|nr:hypothetical protein KIW84_025038 [Pisum sativum]
MKNSESQTEGNEGVKYCVSEVDANIDNDGEDDVQCTRFKSADVIEEDGELDANIEVDGEEAPNGVVEEVTIDPNVVTEEVTTDVNNEIRQEGIDEDYVASEVSSCQNKKYPTEMVHDESEDSNHLYTTLGSDDEDMGMKYPTYKSGQGMKFQLWIMFTNKEMIRDVIKDYGMENQ